MENFLPALSLYIKGYHAMILSGIEGDLTKFSNDIYLFL